MKRTAALVAVLILSTTATATAQSSPAFADGPRVASAMERHYNSTGYKQRLAEADGTVTRRVLCAHDAALRVIECTGRLRVQGRAVTGEWKLEKRTPRRAKLTVTFSGPGVFQRDSHIVRPRAFGISRF